MMQHKGRTVFYTNNSLPVLLGLIILIFCGSCGKSNSVTVAGSNTKLLVVNASPDALPMAVYINTLQLGSSTTTFIYPTPSKYYSMSSGSQLLQVRQYNSTNTILVYPNFVSETDTLKTNTIYSLYLVGLSAATVKADSLSHILVTDTMSSIPALGRAKIRFVNASPRSSAVDVFANGTLAFNNKAYKSVSNTLELPVGTYTFKVSPHGVAATTLTTAQGITLQDGKLYTLFIYGIAGLTNASALGAKVILNQ